MGNPWEAYRESQAKPIHVTMEEIGLPDFWFEIENISFYTPTELQRKFIDVETKNNERIQSKLDEIRDLRDELAQKVKDGELTAEDMEEALEEVENFEPNIIGPSDRFLIKNWNLTSPENPDEVLDLPYEHPEVLFHLPMQVQYFILRKLRDSFREGFAVPKANAAS